MVLLVTPVSVAPVSWPLPQGDGSVPNEVEEVDAAPPTPGVDEHPCSRERREHQRCPQGP